MPAIGGYWFERSVSARAAASTTSGGPFESGKPWPRLIAPVSRARAEEALRSSRQWAQSVLDSIEAPTCALDVAGVIVATNVAWDRFARDNGGAPAQCGVGASYLDVCDRAGRGGDELAGELAVSLRQMLATGAGRAEAEYACHAPDEDLDEAERLSYCPHEGMLPGGGGLDVV